MARSPEFFREMTRDLLTALEEEARRPGVTGDELHVWLTAKGVKTSRSAVYRWLQDFRLEEGTRRAADVARQYLDVAREADPHAVTEASLRRFEELVFDALTNGERLSADELSKLATALRSGLGSKRDVMELKRQQADAVRAAEAAAKSGRSATDVVATIKQALGIAA